MNNKKDINLDEFSELPEKDESQKDLKFNCPK